MMYALAYQEPAEDQNFLEGQKRAALDDMARRYIAFLDASARTVQTYSGNLRRFFSYLKAAGITEPNRATIIDYKAKLRTDGLQAATIQAYMTAVKLFFAWANAEGLYPNIAAHIKGAKLDRSPKKDYLTADQMRQILTAIDRSTTTGKRDYALITLMTVCGLRTIEINRANIEDFRPNGSGMVLFIQGKGREDRAEYVKIPAAAEMAVREYLGTREKISGADPLFSSGSNHNQGGRITTRSISRIVKDRFRAAGYNSERLTAHSLRHTAVTLALLAGEAPTEVQQFARHRNIQTTLIYAHNLDKAKNSCSSSIADAIF